MSPVDLSKKVQKRATLREMIIIFFKEIRRFFLFIMYLIRHVRDFTVYGCWDRTHNCCDLVICSQTLKVHIILDLFYLYVPYSE
jgi:hypothetical protein